MSQTELSLPTVSSLRILFVTTSYPSAQSPDDAPCIATLRRSLQELGHHVDVLLIKSRTSKLNYLKAPGQLIWRILSGSYDIVHSHYGCLCALIARLQWRCPVVVTFRGSDLLATRQRPLSCIVARFIDHAIVMTEEMRQKLAFVPIDVIPYEVDLSVFRPRSAVESRRELGLPLDQPLILFPYDTTRPEKRYEMIVDAVTILNSKGIDVRLISISGLPQVTVAAYMNACDALVMASEREGSPLAVREALMCSLPVISTDVGDIASLLSYVDGCYIVDPTPESIAEKLAVVIQLRRRCDSSYIVQQLSVSKNTREVIRIYAKVCGVRVT